MVCNQPFVNFCDILPIPDDVMSISSLQYGSSKFNTSHDILLYQSNSVVLSRHSKILLQKQKQYSLSLNYEMSVEVIILHQPS